MLYTLMPILITLIYLLKNHLKPSINLLYLEKYFNWKNVKIGKFTHIGSNTIIEHNVEWENCVIGSNVIIKFNNWR